MDGGAVVGSPLHGEFHYRTRSIDPLHLKRKCVSFNLRPHQRVWFVRDNMRLPAVAADDIEDQGGIFI